MLIVDYGLKLVRALTQIVKFKSVKNEEEVNLFA